MNLDPELPAPTAAHYRALIDRISSAARAHNSGEIDFPAFCRLINQIGEEARSLDLLRKLHRACRSLAREEKKRPPSSATS